ncbi:hypothetical protein PoB_003009800 [Plakobranchus ocellatus]|uniref:Uncharacterized protein n=1 Tax=Plakobranchus ocellatus TaxID=259542 RepID=A0AAV4A8L8_9GAST|nr:hypothetical protein PoB_003009800 [Plakobranchus ocellatus]
MASISYCHWLVMQTSAGQCLPNNNNNNKITTATTTNINKRVVAASHWPHDFVPIQGATTCEARPPLDSPDLRPSWPLTPIPIGANLVSYLVSSLQHGRSSLLLHLDVNILFILRWGLVRKAVTHALWVSTPKVPAVLSPARSAVKRYPPSTRATSSSVLGLEQ